MNSGLILNANGSVTLCGRGDGKCCPVMEPFDKFRVKITDDYGNSIIVTKEQAELMTQGVKTLNENQQKVLFD